MPTTYWAFPTQTFTAWDTNGDPVAGAKASIFEAGTTTPLVVYTDTALTTPHAAPIVADANGVFAPIYISGPDEIKIDVTDADDVQLPGYPVDNITGTPIGGLTASGTVYAPSATLAEADVQAAIDTLDTLTQRTRNRLIEAETAGSGNAYTLDALGTITAYADGDIFVLRADRDNAGVATLNVDSVGSKDWKRHDGTSYVDYVSGEIRDGNHYWVEYDSGADEFRTIFEMRRPATQAEAEAGTAIAVAMDALRVKQAIDDRVIPFSEALLHVRDEKSSGTDGGTATSGSWEKRDINTTATNEISGASVASNQITLPAGTYDSEIFVPAYSVDLHKARLYDTTGSATLIKGTSQRSTTTGATVDASKIRGRFTLGVQSVLQIQTKVETTKSTEGHGVATNLDTEVYTEAKFWKVA